MSPREVISGRFSRLVARNSTSGRPAPLLEVATLLIVFLIFLWVHGTVGKDAAAATANAHALQSIERALHLDLALGANQWLTEHPALIQPAVYYYRLYYLAVIGALLWVFVRHAEAYLKVRRTLVAMLLLVLPVFWALPMSPPRFALPGVVDVIAENDLLGGQASRALESGHNVYSAMPSMHVAWSLWCAYAVWFALRATHPRLASLAWIFPLGMMAVVLGTGNHYVLDIAGSITLLILAIACATAWSRLTARRVRREAVVYQGRGPSASK